MRSRIRQNSYLFSKVFATLTRSNGRTFVVRVGSISCCSFTAKLLSTLVISTHGDDKQQIMWVERSTQFDVYIRLGILFLLYEIAKKIYFLSFRLDGICVVRGSHMHILCTHTRAYQ